MFYIHEKIRFLHKPILKTIITKHVFICLVLSLSTTDMLLFLTYGLYYVSASFKVVAKKGWAMNSWNLMFCRPQAVKHR